MLDELTSIILYVPYHSDYTVPQEIKDLLTEKEFFDHCYVKTDFEQEIVRIKGSKEITKDESDVDFTGPRFWEREILEAINRIQEYKESEEAFLRWVSQNGNGVYCIKGDAGTGKTTYLHHLQYDYNYKNPAIKLAWEIVDVQKACTPVRLLSKEIDIPNFGLLSYKVISVILNNIFELFFNGLSADLPALENISHQKSIFKKIKTIFSPEVKEPLTSEALTMVCNISKLYSGYKKNAKEAFPADEVKWFFDDFKLFNGYISELTATDIDDFVNVLCEKINNLIKSEPDNVVLRKLIWLYMTILRSKNSEKKYIISIDNVERIIGNDEICNKQIAELVEHLRHMFDYFENSHDRNIYSKFSAIILMRNTSSRISSLPLQRLDFGGHELDLSDWFPIDKIVSNKLRWYSDHKIAVAGNDLFKDIIGEDSFDGCGPRSLQSKLGMLFNHNKRVIVNLLSRAIEDTNNVDPSIISKLSKLKDAIFNEYETISGKVTGSNNCNGDTVCPNIIDEKSADFTDIGENNGSDNKSTDRKTRLELSRFAARSIIIRLVLNVLQQDGFFKNVVVEARKHGSNSHYSDINNTGVAEGTDSMDNENSSTVRLGYARKILTILYDHSLENPEYMPFDMFIGTLFHGQISTVATYFDSNNSYLRRTITKILFYMNYYNTRDKNWLHFIDIQYNTSQYRIPDEDSLCQLIDKCHDQIGIKIMDAGTAYLRFISASFEFFSCRVEGKSIPPLLALIPSLDDIRKCGKVERLPCYVAAKAVRDDATRCIKKMDERIAAGSPDFPFRRWVEEAPIYHKDRIINAHQGYLNNFLDCLKLSFESVPNMTLNDKKRLSELEKKMKEIITSYKDPQIPDEVKKTDDIL